MYRVKIVSAKINQYDYSTVATGEAWDVPGGMPDPFVQLTVGTAVSKTTTKQDTLTPAWGESFDVFIKQGELFRFDVSDEDLVVNDGIGAFEWKQGLAILTLKAGGQTIKPNPADPKFGVQELVFTIVPLSGTTPTSNSGQTCDQSTPCSSTQDDCLLLTGWTKGMCLAKCAKQGDTCPTADPTKYLSTCALANQTQTQWNCLYICEVQGQTYQCPDPATQDCVASTTPGIKTCKPK
jgi:hypothetical protein